MVHNGVTMPVTIVNCLLTQKPQVQGMRHNSLPDPVKHLLKVCAAVSMLLLDCQMVSDSQDLVSSNVKSVNPCLMWWLSNLPSLALVTFPSFVVIATAGATDW